jgi:hypothetical protein
MSPCSKLHRFFPLVLTTLTIYCTFTYVTITFYGECNFLLYEYEIITKFLLYQLSSKLVREYSSFKNILRELKNYENYEN